MYVVLTKEPLRFSARKKRDSSVNADAVSNVPLYTLLDELLM